MRSRQVSVVALVAVAGFLSASIGATASDTPVAAVEVPSSGIANFPPELPKFLSPAEAAAVTANAAGEAKPAEKAKSETASPVLPAPSAEPPKPVVATPAPIEPAKSEPQKAEAAPAAKPAFALATEIAERIKRERSASAGDREDRDAAIKVYATRNGEPIWVDDKGLTAKALAVMNEIGAADAYGLDAAQFKLPTLAPNAGGGRDDLADADVTLTLAALKYARHARGGRLDPLALSKNFDRSPQIFAPDSVLAELASADKPSAYLRELNPRHPQFERLRLKYLAVKSGQHVIEPPPAPAAQPAAQSGKTAKKQGSVPQPQALSRDKLERKLLANMEMWRWMPDSLGDYYIHNNIPEYMTRMYRGGKLVHAERIVVGKPENQTPIFSDAMELVVFKPFWNVPESIKWKELQPQLSRNPDALNRAGLRASYNGKPVDPATVDWSTADMRALHIFQPPGTANALGQVKFLFPNKHDVYMHDTPTKHLFNNASRAYSHGCMRVRDPLRFAELLLSNDKGWDMDRVRQLANAGPENNEIRLTKKVPVHVTYFTAWVDDDGSLKTFNDIYNHESKIQLGLEGKAHLIAQPRQEKFQAPARGQVRFVEKGWGGGGGGSSTPFEKWVKDVFNF